MKIFKLFIFIGIPTILIIGLIALVSILAFRNISLKNIEDFRIHEKIELDKEVKMNVNVVYSLISTTYTRTVSLLADDAEEVTEDMITNSQLMQNTFEIIRLLKFRHQNYVWVYLNHDPYIIVIQPGMPELEGTSKPSYIINTDTNIYEAFADSLEANSGECYVTYPFSKYDSDLIITKINYLRYFMELDWVLVSSADYEFIDEKANKSLEKLKKHIKYYAFGTITIAVILTVVIVLIVYSILKRPENQ